MDTKQQPEIPRSSRLNPEVPQEDSVEPMSRGARAEVDDFSSGPRQPRSERGPLESERSSTSLGGTTGEHSGEQEEPTADARGSADAEAPGTRSESMASEPSEADIRLRAYQHRR
jgi:hypothetical protein